MLVKLDVDRRQRLSLRTLLRKLDRTGFRLCALGERRSPSGKGWHYWLVLDPLPRSRYCVVALQAILGSDLWREAAVLGRARVARRTPAFARSWWNVLYEPRGEGC